MGSPKARKREPKKQRTRMVKTASTKSKEEPKKTKEQKKSTKRCLKATTTNPTTKQGTNNKGNDLFSLSTDAWTLIRQFLPAQDAATFVTTCRTAYEMVLTDMLRGISQQDMPLLLRYEERLEPGIKGSIVYDETISFLVQTVTSKKSMERRVIKNQTAEPFCADHGQRLQIHIRKLGERHVTTVVRKTSKAKKWREVTGSVCPLVENAVAKCEVHFCSRQSTFVPSEPIWSDATLDSA